MYLQFSVPFATSFAEPMLESIQSSDCDLRQAAVYGIGMMAQNGAQYYGAVIGAVRCGGMTGRRQLVRRASWAG